jgi:hypothetical protein
MSREPKRRLSMFTAGIEGSWCIARREVARDSSRALCDRRDPPREFQLFMLLRSDVSSEYLLTGNKGS